MSQTPKISCGLCHKQMTRREYETNHLELHNYLCWIEGEKPVDPKSMTDVNTAFFKARRIKKGNFKGFKCEKCGVRKMSGVGYMSHLQVCGMSDLEKEAVKVACGVCGRFMMPSSLKVHMAKEHKDPSTVKSLNSEMEKDEPMPKRVAATKAESKLEQVLASESIGDNIGIKKLKRANLYRKTLTRLFPRAYTRWTEELKKNNCMKCVVEGCSFTTKILTEIKSHFYQCPFAKREFVCKVCNHKEETEIAINKHVVSKHGNYSFTDGDLADYDENESKDELVINDEEIIVNKACDSRPSFFVKQKDRLKQLKHILEDTNKRLSQNSPSEPLYQEFIAPVDEVLSKTEAEKFIPSTKKSIKFSSTSSNWQQLNRFSGCLFGNSKLMFVGGPVWALAWCPTSVNETRQYVAVACHPDMHKVHAEGSTISYNSIIQIWDCGNFTNLDKEIDEHVPTFKLGLAHSGGAVWCLAWCPAGCYQPYAGRLGILAVGFSSGSAALYSVSARQISSTRLPICKSNPILHLEIRTDAPSQCTRLTWCKNMPYNIIACGYADGLVALFDLTSTSSLLRKGNVLFPYHMFQAHNKSITAVEFLPFGRNNYLMTSSFDREIKYWNLSDTYGPISVSHMFRMAFSTDAVFMNHGLSAASVYDDCLGYNQSNVFLSNCRDFTFGQPLSMMSQNSLHWSISANDWNNSIVTSSEIGEIVSSRCIQLYNPDDKLIKTTKKFLNTVELCNLNGEENEEISSLKLRSPESYEEAIEQYGLILKSEKIIRHRPVMREESYKTLCQIRSVNKVAWNTNCKSFLYLTAGYHCGLVQILKDVVEDSLEMSILSNFYEGLQLTKE